MVDSKFFSGAASRRLWRIGRWVGVMLAVGAVAYLVRFAPLDVETVSPERTSLVAEVMGTGTLEARVSTTVSPKISGRIRRVLVDQGEDVDESRQLVQLDDDEWKQQVAIAEANVEAARAAVVRLSADKERSVAVFEQAQRHHTRVRTLRESNATTVDDLERAAESLAVAVAERTRAEAAIAEGDKGLIAAEKTLEYHRARLADTQINAPFGGLIVTRHREAGDIVVPGSAILTLIATDVLWISAWVDETQMSRLAVGQPARVVFRSQPDRSYAGTLARLGQQADRETREFVVDVQVPELPANWAVGQRAEVFIETDRRDDVLTIPSRPLIWQGSQAGVFVVEDGIARWRPLTLGLRGRETVEVLAGLTASDRVIQPVTGGPPLKEGRRVKVP